MLLGIVVLLFVAICTPEAVLIQNTGERNARIQKIQSLSDLRQVQGAATGLVEAAYATSSTAFVLCYMFLGTLLLTITGSIITLRQVRRIRRESHEQSHTTA